MGDLELTQEDLVNLGEAEPGSEAGSEEEGPETQETETPEGEGTEETETEHAAKEGTDTGSAPEGQEDDAQDEPDKVQKRIDTLTYEREENKRKLDLLKRDPEEYYQRFPDEKPEEAAVPRETPVKAMSFSEAANMIVHGGPYDGQTLAQVWEKDQFGAMDLYTEYRDGVMAQVEQSRKATEATQQSISQEHDAFTEARAKEFYGKGLSDLSKDEAGRIHNLMMSYMDQMEEMRVYSLETMHKLASVDDRVKKSVESLIKSAGKATVTHIDAKKTVNNQGGGNTYGAMMDYSPAQMATHLDKLNPAQTGDFWKKAPPELVEKFRAAAEPWM